MVRERTLSIIKPDAVRNKLTGKIISLFEQAGFEILSQRKIQLTKNQAERFYSVHSKRPFFGSLVSFMSSGPCIVQVLEKENAVVANRELMGATNPQDAAPGTIRKLYGTDVEANAVHGSDSLENAQIEIQFFFGEMELLSECL